MGMGDCVLEILLQDCFRGNLDLEVVVLVELDFRVLVVEFLEMEPQELMN